MKRLLEKIGMWFLKRAGWNIPKQRLKRVMEPIVISNEYDYSSGDELSAIDLQKIRNVKMAQLMHHCEKYVNTIVEENEVTTYVKMEIIVQRPDPEGSGEK